MSVSEAAIINTVSQKQKAVTTCISSQQLLFFDFVE